MIRTSRFNIVSVTFGMAFLYLPIVILIVLSFNRAGMPTAWTGFSLDWYGKLAASPKIIAATRNSLIVAASSTAIATVLGTMLAIGIERRRASPKVDAPFSRSSP